MRLSAHTDISGSFPQSGVPAFRLIEGQLGQVKELIDEQLTSSSNSVGRLLRYTGNCRGKMIRPRLVLLAGAAVGKVTDEHLRIAAIVEMIHNATLLHDDVIDDGKKRRGLPTVNSLWGNESAVLLGDFLLSRVFKMCTDLEPKIAGTIAAAAQRVCEGELRQIIQRRNRQLSEPEYIDIITEKSASLFSACCELGGLSAAADEQKVRLLGCFGQNVGIAFQITDDLLDIIGEETDTGKTLGSDAASNKPTLAVIHLLRTVDEREKAAVIEKLDSPSRGREVLVEMLSRSGSLEYAHSRSQEYVEKAIESLAGLRESNARDALIEMARFVAVRAVSLHLSALM